MRARLPPHKHPYCSPPTKVLTAHVVPAQAARPLPCREVGGPPLRHDVHLVRVRVRVRVKVRVRVRVRVWVRVRVRVKIRVGVKYRAPEVPG